MALSRRDAPTVLILSRQGLHTLPGPQPVERGAYVLEDGDDCILIATGSEVGVALEARGVLKGDGISARVVSMPSFELFRAQDRSYRDEVLPPALTARVAVEAASPFGWAEWVGADGADARRDDELAFVHTELGVGFEIKSHVFALGIGEADGDLR